MKNEKWLIYVIVGFTSITTVLLLMGDSLLGFVRAVLAAIVLDGLIAYWEDKRTTLKDDRQRKVAEYMMWAGVGIVGIFALGFAVEYNVPVDATQTVDLFGYTFAMTLTDFILMLAAGMIGGWLVLTLGVVLYMRGIDPEILKQLDHTKALQDRDAVEMAAYREALKVTAKQIGTEKAVNLFKKNLLAEGYNEAQIQAMEQDARFAIERAQASTVDGRAYQSNAQAVKEVFTPPSTPTK
jgi:hypothetical protein